MFAGDVTISEGDELSIDGTSGAVYAGRIPLEPPPIVAYFEGTLDPAAPEADGLVRAVHRLLQHADQRRTLGVRANADTPDDAARARRFGAEGIGLCRTEHMFLGARRVYVERLVLADTDAERAAALADLLPLQRADFVGLFEAMDGAPVTIRLIDPPLHEFLPDRTELAVRVALAQAAGDVQRARRAAARGDRAPARGQPDARPARRAPRFRRARTVRDADPGRGRGGRRGPRGGVTTCIRRSWCRWWPRSRSSTSPGASWTGSSPRSPRRPARRCTSRSAP